MTSKICALCKQNFQIDDEDLAFYEKIGVPTPSLCPEDRQRRRAAFRNERYLFRRKCDGTGKDIVSMYSPDKPFKIFDQDFWWGDSWSPLDFGQDFDFNRPFFEQLKELQLKVPRLSLYNFNSENSYYTNHSGENKNCYMDVDTGGCQDVYFSNWITGCKNCIDCSYTHKSELCYFCLYSENCFNCNFCFDCKQLQDCSYCFDCRSCSSCFLCTGLRKKQFHILNKKVTPEEYKEFVEKYKYSYEMQNEARKQLADLMLQTPHKYAHVTESEDCTGDYIFHCKNAQKCYDAWRLWDCKYCYNTLDTKNGYDCYQPGYHDCELVYEVHAGHGLFSSKFLHLCRDVHNCDYADNCFDSNNLFGCIGIKHNEYCILNKKYSPEEYKALRAKIIEHMSKTGEWGEFFPFSYSPFGYNETKAQEYYPITKEDAVANGFNWSEYEASAPTGQGIVPPDDVRTVNDSIINNVISCEITGKPFKIIKQELEFYRQKGLPIPHKSPQKRYEERMMLRNPRHLYDRNCSKCGAAIKTTYSPDRKEVIYCDKCYLEAIY
ncbi:MAG: hypothetical protein WCT53_03625 [Candidatus Gracilibacteria bacterium]|jgi:hypothetical protein